MSEPSTAASHDPADFEYDDNIGMTKAEREEVGRVMATLVSVRIAQRAILMMTRSGLDAEAAEMMAAAVIQPAAHAVLGIFFTAHENQLGALDDYMALEEAIDG
jgi:hypothetical protein